MVSAGNNARAYEAALDSETRHSGSAGALVRCLQKRSWSDSGFGTLMQIVKADGYGGKRVRLAAWVKATKGGKPRLWLRVDGQIGETLAFDNMDSRAKGGPFDWRLQEVVLDVPPDALLINFGLIVNGDGAGWIDDASLDVVDTDTVKVTRKLDPPIPPGGFYANTVRSVYERSKARPVNLDFEQQPAR